MRRSGGLVASRPLETEVDLRSGGGDAAAIAELLESVDMARLDSRPAPPGRSADTFQYELTVEADGRTQTFRIGDRNASPQLRRLLEHLEQRALAAIREARREASGGSA